MPHLDLAPSHIKLVGAEIQMVDIPERERILQSIKERFPSRYRQLVEQYYRSLAEQK